MLYEPENPAKTDGETWSFMAADPEVDMVSADVFPGSRSPDSDDVQSAIHARMPMVHTVVSAEVLTENCTDERSQSRESAPTPPHHLLHEPIIRHNMPMPKPGAAQFGPAEPELLHLADDNSRGASLPRSGAVETRAEVPNLHEIHVGLNDDESSLQQPVPMQEPEAGSNPHQRCSRLLRAFSRKPRLCSSIVLIVGAIVIITTCAVGILLNSPEPELDFSTFMKTDAALSEQRDVFSDAKKKRTEDGRRLSSLHLFSTLDLAVAYSLEGQGSIVESDILVEIAKFEQELTGNPAWRELCLQTDVEFRGQCLDGISLVKYALPIKIMRPGTVLPGRLNFTGLGQERVPLPTLYQVLSSEKIADVVLPKGTDLATLSHTQTIRTIYRFYFPCCFASDPPSEQKRLGDANNKKWDKFTTQTLLPILQNRVLKFEKGPKVKVFFTGTGLSTLEIMQELMADVYLAFASIAFVLLYILFHTGSVMLSILGLLQIVIAVPLSYVFFSILAQTKTMSIASFLSLFLIVGLGSDVVFVYTDFWRESAHLADNSLPSRVLWTYERAGKASLATTATTALSFFANLASVLKPLREFGFFMGLCVVLVWVVISLLYIPACILDESCCCRLTCLQRVSSGGESIKVQALRRWEDIVFRFKRPFLIVSTVMCVVMAICIAFLVETDTSVPNIFPRDHNQNIGKEILATFPVVDDKFPVFSKTPISFAEVCREYEFQTADTCSLFWCEVDARKAKADPGACQCFLQNTAANACPAQQVINVVQRISGNRSLLVDEMTGPLGNFLTSRPQHQVTFSGSRSQRMLKKDIAPLVLHEWESGNMDIKLVTQVTSQVTRKDAASPCGWNEICFCDSPVCQLPQGWSPSGSFTMSSPPARVLSSIPSWTVPTDKQASIDVIFGIEVVPGSPLLGERNMEDAWLFSPDFEIAHPWAQRNLHAFCSDIPAELKVVLKACWIEEFKKFVAARQQRFPLIESEFNSWRLQFNSGLIGDSIPADTYLWIRNRQVKALYATFRVDISRQAQPSQIFKYKDKWDNYLTNYNNHASRFARGAWHTSSLWVRAEAQDQLISSTIATLVLVLVLAFLGMLIFTRDFTLSGFVVLATISVVIELTFMMAVVLRWKIGPIETVALIVFIGYTVTYSLHITHRYGCAKLDGDMTDQLSRRERTLSALGSIGAAALGSAVTTVGASIFLLFCTLTIFGKLGGVVILVTILSIMTALGPLPAALVMAGPVRPGHALTRAALQNNANRFRYAMTHANLDAKHMWRQTGPAVARITGGVLRIRDADANQSQRVENERAHFGSLPETSSASRAEPHYRMGQQDDQGFTGDRRDRPAKAAL